MNAVPRGAIPDRERYYRYYRRQALRLTPNTEWLCQILASWSAGEGALPDALGLEPTDFTALQGGYFPKLDIPAAAPSGLRADFSRMLERDDLLRHCLEQAAHPEREETRWMAHLLVAACLGDDHLWQDLGLWSRQDLTDLIAYNFPALAGANHQGMRWKKFLYKQLCATEGIYICRAPSCEVCVDYPLCFGAEEQT